MGVVHVVVRLSPEDNELLETMAKHFGTSKADIIRWALKEFAKNHGFLK
jgi:predicted DNA-binding protein